jgi:3-oxoacyl-[acyl-carrier protein] reductase
MKPMNNISFDFIGSTVLVIGGSKGIGKSISNQFSASGARVFCASRTSYSSDSINFIKCDISKEEDIENLFREIDEKAPRLDFVINVAGTNLCEPIENISSAEWDRVVNTNLKSFYLICRESVKRMKPNKFGRIVNVSSIAGRNKSIVSGVHYTSSKAGIIGLTRQLAHEVSKHGINVNVTCPSQTLTEMLEQSMTSKQISDLEEKIPIKRIATVEEQALPVLFLCSDAASYITGAAIDINGGQL